MLAPWAGSRSPSAVCASPWRGFPLVRNPSLFQNRGRLAPFVQTGDRRSESRDGFVDLVQTNGTHDHAVGGGVVGEQDRLERRHIPAASVHAGRRSRSRWLLASTQGRSGPRANERPSSSKGFGTSSTDRTLDGRPIEERILDVERDHLRSHHRGGGGWVARFSTASAAVATRCATPQTPTARPIAPA